MSGRRSKISPVTGYDYSRKFPFPVGAVVRGADTFGRPFQGTVTRCVTAFDVVIDGRVVPVSLVTEVISSPDDDFDFEEGETL